jgi:hypothetical protein
MDFDHEHDGEKDRYTRQVAVKPGTTRQKGSSRRKLSKEMANFANTRDVDGEAVNTQGYMRGGSGGKIKVGGKNLLEVKTGTRGGGSYKPTSYSDKKYDDVNWRDISKQIKKTGSASVVDGKVSTGTSQTKKAYGSVKRDNKRKANAATKAQNKANLTKRREAQAREREDRKKKYAADKALKASEIVKRRKEYAANKNKK